MKNTINLQSKTGRAELASRPAPHFVRLESGLFLGYRAMKSGVGTWIARKRGDDGKQSTFALGTFAEYADAARAARKWAGAVDAGVTDHRVTVAEACKFYVENMKTNNSARAANDTDARFKRLVYDNRIGAIPLAKLKPEHIRAWLNSQVSIDDDDDEAIRRSKDTANRNFSSLKAALNMAFRDGNTATKPWEAVKSFAGVAKGRAAEHYLTFRECDMLIGHMQDDMALFSRALLLTACRPGELAGVRVCDFDRKTGTLALTGKTGSRVVTLGTAACTFFSMLAQGKIGQALLLHRADGVAWDKDYWKKQFNKARTMARLPDGIVLYSLRHVAISDMLNAGMDSHIIARLAGTSTAMIDKNYGHLRHNKVRAMLDAVQAGNGQR